MPGVRRRGVDAWLAAVTGAGYVGLGPLAVLDPTRLERSVCRAVDGRSGSAPALRVPQQLGTPWLLPAMAVTGSRVHRGAPSPLDGVGGVPMGVCTGALLNHAFGLPELRH